jgi:hypothetical protein
MGLHPRRQCFPEKVMDVEPVDVEAWLTETGLNLAKASEELGVHRASLRKYRAGSYAPRVVRLAMKAVQKGYAPLTMREGENA